VSVVANVAINIDGKQAQNLLKAIQGEVEKLNGAFEQIPKKTGGIFDKLKGAATSAVGQLAAVTGAAFTLQKAFDTLAAQSKTDAALRSLNVNAEQAGVAFRQLSADLAGQASQVELTAAAYDVASAGFGNVADQTKILEAATKGAVGGMSDINTVGNAVTSVLNAYGMSAGQANTLVDQFIQTQNDGKIILAEYAGQIGRLAPTASAAGVGIDELNAAISTITAQGVPVEATFTGLNQALVAILKPSKEAADLAAQLGVDFSESGLRAKGFGGLLSDVAKATGGSTSEMTKLFGSVDALKAVLPLISGDMEKFNKNLENQQNSAGVATKAFNDMKDTLGGALKEVQTSFENLVVAFKPVVPAIIAPFKVLASTVDLVASNIKGLLVTATFIGTFVGVLNAAAIATKAWALATQGLAAAKKAAGVAAAFLQAVLNPASIAKTALALGIATAAGVGLAKAMGDTGDQALQASEKQSNIASETAKLNSEIKKELENLDKAPAKIDAATEAQNRKVAAVQQELTAAKQNTLAIEQQVKTLDLAGRAVNGRFQVEKQLNDLQIQQLERQYSFAKTEGDRLKIATQILREQLQGAQIEYNQAIARLQIEQQKLRLQIEAAAAKQNEIIAEGQLQKLKAQSVEDEAKRLQKMQEIDAATGDALTAQRKVVQGLIDQLPIQDQLLQQEEQNARLKFEANKLTARGAFEQKAVSKEIGLSQDQAVRLSGAIGQGVTVTRQLQSGMAGVAREAANAAQQIQNAINLQNMLRGGGNQNAGPQQAAEGAYWSGGFKAFADGGVVSQPTLGLVGEGGESEYIIPASKMDEAMARYASGQRGSSVIPSSINPQVNVTTGPVMNMNGSNYVSQNDFMTGMQTASRRGAEMALQMLQGSNSARRAVGIR
jgi:TP901 family phage tail tape measure protein